MNKQKGIIIGILALIVTMMVGYAIFSDTITINGTATAKGDFNMQFTCNTGADLKFGDIEDFLGIYEGGYKNDSCTVSGNTVSLSLELEYPGAARYFTIKMTNTGTIDSTINLEQDFTLTGKVCIDGGPHLENPTNGQIEENECYDPNTLVGYNVSIYQIAILGYDKKDGTFVMGDGSEFVDENGNVRLKTSESLYIILLGSVSDSVNSNTSKAKSLLMTTDISYSFNWKQVTN